MKNKNTNKNKTIIIKNYKSKNFIKAYVDPKDDFDKELEKLMSEELYYGNVNYY